VKGALLLAAALTLGFSAGWLTVVRAAPPALEARASDAVAIHHGGETIGAARERLAALGFAVPVVTVVEEMAPPPPPDIAVLFRRDLTAIEQRDGGPLVWIVDDTIAAGRRGLKAGDVYQDGWRIASVDDQVIELRRRRESRRIDVYEAPQEASP
jgi:S1-C subfamily serine protease